MGSITPAGPQPLYPIGDSVKDKIDPVYAKFYNQYIINSQQVHYQPVSASRTSGVLIPGAGPKLPVAVRVFTPTGTKPENGWPMMLYFHGGGWVLGNIDTENVVCTNLCNRANFVVVTVDYRLAPESPYPAAVHDSWEALLWLQRTGASLLSCDLSKVALGGSSAGGNLAAIMCHKSLSSSLTPKIVAQLLIVPVTDNTAWTDTNISYKENEFTAALPAEKMLWYREHYLPDEKTWAEPEASPLLYQDEESWKKQPKALVVVGELDVLRLDVLRSEGEAYAEKLRKAGVAVDLKIMKGMPHPFLAMDGVLQQGRDTITFMVEKLVEAFDEK